MRSKYTFVIVGGGIAGVSCLQSINAWLPNETVLLVSSTSVIKAATKVVQITKTLFDFQVEETPAEEFSTLDNVDVLIDTVKSVDSYNSCIFTLTGRKIYFKRICLCMGGKPRLIVENHPYVLGVRDTDSVAKLREKLSGARRVVITGNGGIASELVYEVKGVEKIWVVKDKYINSVFLDPGAAEFIKNVLANDNKKSEAVIRRIKYTGFECGASLGPDWLNGGELIGNQDNSHLKIEYNSSIVDVKINTGEEFPVTVTLDNGTEVKADLVISATGVTPLGNSITISPCNLKLADDGGILVDERFESSVKNIYAAGDVVTNGWNAAKHWFQMRLWSQARQMGTHAGRVMSASLNDEEVHLDFSFEIFSHVTRFFGLRVVLLGLFNAQKLNNDCELLLRVTQGHEYVKLVMENGRVQGAVLIGETDLEEMCENLILDQLDVSSLGEHLLDPDVDIDDYFD